MPILPIFKIHIFSNTYEFRSFLGRPKVTNVVKNNVKKLSVGQKITDGLVWQCQKGSGVPGSKVQRWHTVSEAFQASVCG
jgi:hypothetical protein